MINLYMCNNHHHQSMYTPGHSTANYCTSKSTL